MKFVMCKKCIRRCRIAAGRKGGLHSKGVPKRRRMPINAGCVVGDRKNGVDYGLKK